MIRMSQRPELRKIVYTTDKIRKKYGTQLEELLKIDPIQIGRTIYKQKMEKQQSLKDTAASAKQSTISTSGVENEEDDMAFEEQA